MCFPNTHGAHAPRSERITSREPPPHFPSHFFRMSPRGVVDARNFAKVAVQVRFLAGIPCNSGGAGGEESVVAAGSTRQEARERRGAAGVVDSGAVRLGWPHRETAR